MPPGEEKRDAYNDLVDSMDQAIKVIGCAMTDTVHLLRQDWNLPERNREHSFIA
jgi:hypothetical protein